MSNFFKNQIKAEINYFDWFKFQLIRIFLIFYDIIEFLSQEIDFCLSQIVVLVQENFSASRYLLFIETKNNIKYFSAVSIIIIQNYNFLGVKGDA
jgi:hypothetical protein